PQQPDGWWCTEFHFPAAAVRFRHFGFALAVPYLGAARLRFRAFADGNAARGSAEKIRALRFDSHRAAVAAAGGATLDANSRLVLSRQHSLRRLGGHAAEGLES